MVPGSDKLREAFAAIHALASRQEVGGAVRAELKELAAEIGARADRLAEIENLYALDFGTAIDPQVLAAAKLWEDVAPGWIRDPELAAIRTASPLLGSLYRKGIDFIKAYKFSDVEMGLSREIGNNYAELSPLLSAFRRSRRKGAEGSEMTALIPLRRALARLLSLFETRGVLRIKRMLVQARGKWVPFKREWMRRDSDSEKVLVIYEGLNIDLARLTDGEWLSCYVYHIIFDQLSRNMLPFELYTNLSYRTPQDQVRAASEFDVIGRMRDTVVCVECKSGRLDQERGDFSEIARKTNGLKSVLEAQGTGEIAFHFFVVYDPDQNDPDAVAGELARNGIGAIRPSEVRSVMAAALCP